MKSGLRFLIAAKRCEIDELDQLGHTSELVVAVGCLVHALQRERGLSNLWLTSGGERLAVRLERQVAESREFEAQVRAQFDQLETQMHRTGARLFSRVAWVLSGLDALPSLRQRIGTPQLQATQATAAFTKLIAGLLAVVFEAADGAADPEVSKLLVAMFNFMQGKEFAGQERAFGAAALALEGDVEERRQHWQHLIESQERCFEVFAEFSDAALLEIWRASQGGSGLAELERLRRVGPAPAGRAFDPLLSQAWFDCCTRRIDAMKTVEEHLATELRERCGRKAAQARRELQRHQHLLATWAPQADDLAASPSAAVFFDDTQGEMASTAYGRQLERAVLDMMQVQSRRLQIVSAELETVRASLNERKLVERAKGLLMAHRRLSEEEAHKMLRQTAMNQGRRLVEVAESLLSMADYLSISAPPVP
ncbi:MAG: antitermination regulator [Variovorax sp.]|nr:antitermination regulator [Variovorax sp.]